MMWVNVTCKKITNCISYLWKYIYKSFSILSWMSVKGHGQYYIVIQYIYIYYIVIQYFSGTTSRHGFSSNLWIITYMGLVVMVQCPKIKTTFQIDSTSLIMLCYYVMKGFSALAEMRNRGQHGANLSSAAACWSRLIPDIWKAAHCSRVKKNHDRWAAGMFQDEKVIWLHL